MDAKKRTLGTFIEASDITKSTKYAGLYYTFRLKSFYVGATSSDFSIAEVIITNRAVYGGSLSVIFSTGYAFDTNFYYVTQGWLADAENYPLLFSMSYSTSDSTDGATVKSRSPSLFAEAYLSAGLQSMLYAVTCYVQAFDTLGGTSTASTQVSVFYLHHHWHPLIHSLLKPSVNSDTDLIMQMAFSAANELNTVNCSFAPVCTQLNRESCTIIAHACGPYLNGCLRNTGPVVRDEHYCRSDSECLSGLCLNKTCVTRMMMCNANCSNAGKCNYYDSTDDNLAPSCYYTDTHCYAKCDCFPGHASYSLIVQ